MKNNVHQPIIFFDGVCNLCNSSVNYFIKRDKKNILKFASLQSDAAKQILLQFGVEKVDLKSIIVLNNNKLYLESSAIIEILKQLGGIYKIFTIFWIIPKPIRDFLYQIIAKNRYRWFGKKESCMIPTPELKNKFIE